MSTQPGFKPDCKNCPSFLTASDSVRKFKKSVGAPMCGRFGHVLGRESLTPQQNTAIRQNFADNCDMYAAAATPTPQEYKLEVALPVPKMLGLEKKSPQDVSTCLHCINYIPAHEVESEFGWVGAGLCAIKGKLLLGTRLTYEARDCEEKSFRLQHEGEEFPRASEVKLLPIYDGSAFGGADPIKAYFKKVDSGFVDPKDWVTDKEVTQADSAMGIRAWRAIADPSGGGAVTHLPIYSGSLFDDVESKKIPQTGDDEHPELYLDHGGFTYKVAVAWQELDETPALWGKAGTGKTELLRHMAWLMQLPFERISVTESTELDDIAGKTLYTPEKGTYFQYGRLPEAWSKPSVICLDEPNVGQPAVWQFIRPLTDNSKQLVLDASAGETIDRHENCYLGLAMNPAWDPLNVGANQISDADASRLMQIQVDLPPEELEKEIIRERVKLDGWEIEDSMLNMVMSIAKDIRAYCDSGTLQMSWGIRHQIKVARALRWFDPITAYRVAAADYLEPTAAQMVLDQVRQHNGDGDLF